MDSDTITKLRDAQAMSKQHGVGDAILPYSCKYRQALRFLSDHG